MKKIKMLNMNSYTNYNNNKYKFYNNKFNIYKWIIMLFVKNCKIIKRVIIYYLKCIRYIKTIEYK
jgi:hypothetical protein